MSLLLPERFYMLLILNNMLNTSQVGTMLIFVMFVIICFIKSVESDTEYLTFKDCQGPNSKKWREVNEEDQDYQIDWSGDATVARCKLVFHGWNPAATKELNRYKICIEATTWNFKDQRYSRETDPSPTTKWCAESSEVVAIRIVTWKWRLDQDLGRVTLRVTAIKTYDETKFVMTIVGPVLGAGIVIFVIIYCCVRSHRKRRYQASYRNYRNEIAQIRRSENHHVSPMSSGRQSPNQQGTDDFVTMSGLELNESRNFETVEPTAPPPSYATIGPPPPSYESVMKNT